MSYHVVFICNFFVIYSAMKLVNWLLHSDKKISLHDFFLSPYLAVRSFHIRPTLDSSALARFPLFLLLTTCWILLFKTFSSPLNNLEILIFSPAIYFFTETIGALGQLVFIKNKTHPIHKNPLSATSLSHFWGRTWNTWVQDWLKDVTKRLNHHIHQFRIIGIFLVSGLFHELMCNLPYWIVYQKSYFGTMMAYFLIQAIALWIDKKMISGRNPIWRRIYLWAAVILPSPLFINVPLLTFFGLEHG